MVEKEVYLERKLNLAYLRKQWLRVFFYKVLLKIVRWKNEQKN